MDAPLYSGNSSQFPFPLPEESPHFPNTKTFIILVLLLSLWDSQGGAEVGVDGWGWGKPSHIYVQLCPPPSDWHFAHLDWCCPYMEANYVYSPMLAYGLLSMLMQNTSSPTDSAQITSHCHICGTNSPMTSNLSMGNRAFCCQWPVFLLVDLTVCCLFPQMLGKCHTFLSIYPFEEMPLDLSLSGPNDTLWFTAQQSEV